MPEIVTNVEFFDPTCRMYVPGNSLLERLWTGARWTEGPVYFADGDYVLFSDIPNNRILRWVGESSGLGSVSVFRSPSRYTNGNTRDPQGRLVSCEHGESRVTRTEHDGTITVVAERYEGNRLNSPNDVVVRSDGSVWFTDPPYGLLTDYEGHRRESELDGCYVFRVDPSGELTIVADDFDRPNGLAFSPDERRLYVSDTGRSDDPQGPPHIRVFDVTDAGGLAAGGRFADMSDGSSDGFRLDTDGNVWTSAGSGINCYNPAGDLLLRIDVPERVSNLVFGGPKRNRLFITGHTSLYSIYVGQNGALSP